MVVEERKAMEALRTELTVRAVASEGGPDAVALMVAVKALTKVLGEPVARGHSKDSECTVVDGECVVCGVSHGTSCRTCGGRGYHTDDCKDSEEGCG